MKNLAIFAASSLLALSSSAFAGGGSSGTIFNALAGPITCVSQDGSQAEALKQTITSRAGELDLHYLKFDAWDTVHYIILSNNQAGLTTKAVAVPVTVGKKAIKLAGAPVITFTSFDDDFASHEAVANASALFSKPLASQWLDNDNILVQLPVSPVGLCNDETANVQVLLTFN